jgi:hypothetical protein
LLVNSPFFVGQLTIFCWSTPPFFAGKITIFDGKITIFCWSTQHFRPVQELPLGAPDGFMVLGRAKAAAAEAALRVRLRVRQLGGSLA